MLPDELEQPARNGPPLGFWIFLVLLSTLILSKVFVVGLVEVRGQSMDPLIASGSTCLVLKVGAVSVAGFELGALNVGAGDVVVAEVSGRQRHVIKRVAAIAGEKLSTAPWLDRLKLTKNAAGQRVSLLGVDCAQDGCRVEKGFAFLLSEQLKGSTDSRHFGAVQVADILGRTAVCW